MPKLSSQDVRDKILALRDELILNLEFIQSAIRQDREKLQEYFQQHGDLRYRPVTNRDVDGRPITFGDPTEIFIEPLATQARTTVKSLLDSIRVIEAEILPEDNPEGRDSIKAGESVEARKALRASFQAEAPPEAAPELASEPGIEAEEEIVRTPKEAEAKRETAPSAPTPRPWRETRAGAPAAKPAPLMDKSDLAPDLRKMPGDDIPTTLEGVPEKIETKPTSKPSGPVGLSPRLRASLAGTVASGRMSAMKDKYRKED